MTGPKLNRDWVGLRVKLRRECANAHGTFPRGATGTVESYTGGKKGICFQMDECEHCHVALRVSGMRRHDFVILTPPEDWPDTRGRGKRYRYGF